VRLLKPTRQQIRLCLLTLLLISLGQSAFGDNGISLTEQGFTITLSEESQQAINNGVSLTFVCEFAMQKKYAFLTWNTAHHKHQFRVSRHALSNRYLVRTDNLQKPKIFVSLAQTMTYISSSSMHLFRNYIAKQSKYKMRLSLSKYELPGPMRLNAFISSDWNLNTGWIAWTPAS